MTDPITTASTSTGDETMPPQWIETLFDKAVHWKNAQSPRADAEHPYHVTPQEVLDLLTSWSVTTEAKNRAEQERDELARRLKEAEKRDRLFDEAFSEATAGDGRTDWTFLGIPELDELKRRLEEAEQKAEQYEAAWYHVRNVVFDCSTPAASWAHGVMVDNDPAWYSGGAQSGEQE